MFFLSLYIRQYRRLDIMVVPYKEFPLALVHFTGSGHMNRSMRSKADKMVCGRGTIVACGMVKLLQRLSVHAKRQINYSRISRAKK